MDPPSENRKMSSVSIAPARAIDAVTVRVTSFEAIPAGVMLADFASDVSFITTPDGVIELATASNSTFNASTADDGVMEPLSSR